jgi:hypothetical protein
LLTYLIDISENNLLQIQDLTIVPSTVKVRTFTNIFLSFTLNQNLPRKSSLSLRFRGGRNNKNDWYYLQPYDLNMNGYITTNLNHYCHVLPILITGKDLLIQYRIIGEEGIDANQRLAFEIKKTLAQSIVEENKKIEILVELPGERVINLYSKHTIDVISEEKDHFTIICPSTIKSKEKFEALIRVEDKFYNLVKDFQGEFDFFKESDSSSDMDIVGRYKFEKSCKGILRIPDLSFDNIGVNYLVLDFNSFRYQSNPILCQDKNFKKRLFWGYIHGHTSKSDGIRGLKDYYQNMKNAGLDFGTSTEHDHRWETTDEDFKEIREIVEKNNQDQRFVTFFGYEWGYWYTPGYGDICIYHNNNAIPILRADTNKFNSTQKLIKNLSPFKSEILMIGHHTALRPGYRNWTNFNGQLEKLVEIYSTWGNQEYSFKDGNPLPPRYKFFGYGPYAIKRGPILEKSGSFVQDALKRGYKLGFTAGGDDHYGIYPSGPIDPDNGIYPSGIMAIWAKDLTRESIWHALNQRSCYGTTGPRVIIEFTLDKYTMGEIINLKDSKHLMNSRKIRLRIISPSRILKLELLRNNYIFKEKVIQEDYCELEYHDVDEFNKVVIKTSHKEKFLFYYLRIFLEHNNMAWSSPIWVIST